jgi:Flp pilus assembly protein TadD
MAVEDLAVAATIAITLACASLTGCTLAGATHEPGSTVEAKLRIAAEAEALGNSELAISMYLEAATREPDNIEVQLRYADALVRSGKASQARRLLTERLSTNPGQPELMKALALIDLVSGDTSQAIAGLDRVLAASPSNVPALVDKAVALDLQGQHAAAQGIYREVLAKTPNDPATMNDLAVSLMLEGHTRQALETLAPLQGVDNVPQRIKVNLGILYAAAGKLEQSRQLLGDGVSDHDLATLTRAIASSATNAHH